MSTYEQIDRFTAKLSEWEWETSRRGGDPMWSLDGWDSLARALAAKASGVGDG